MENINDEECLVKQKNDNQCVVKKNDSEITNVVEPHCVQVMEKVFHGQFWLLPLFAQSLISYIYEDIPQNENPRIIAHHISTRGMYVLQKAMQLDNSENKNKFVEQQNEDTNDTNNTNNVKKENDNLLREVIALGTGICFGKKNFLSFLLGMGFLIKTTYMFEHLSNNQQNIMTVSYIAIVAFTLS
tara:strand:+ start:1098 stop:1655 length:558 start_codon:yes stop_codon:yes gene_type:complete